MQKHVDGAAHRNVLDWVPSMQRAPWGARAHCNLTWREFLEAEWSPRAILGLVPFTSSGCDAASDKVDKSPPHVCKGYADEMCKPCIMCAEEIPHYNEYLRQGSFEISAEDSRELFGDAICPKFDTQAERHPVIYERQYDRYARNILELRAWKARRAIELLQVHWQQSSSKTDSDFKPCSHKGSTKSELQLRLLP